MDLSIVKAYLIARLGINDERGANLFLLVFIALIVVAVTALGGKVSEKFSSASDELG